MNAPDTLTLADSIRLQPSFSRSVNLDRDAEALDLVANYVPTSRAREALRRLAEGLGEGRRTRALALVGPYGSGKSACALFAGALLAHPEDARARAAQARLGASDQALAAQIRGAIKGTRGYLRVAVNGIPDSLARQLLRALAHAVRSHGLPATLARRVEAVARPGIGLDVVLNLLHQVRTAWHEAGGAGVLIELDELGKFLEYEAYHPQHREMHLLQLLAEESANAPPAPLVLLVMLHQAFEQYGARLGASLRDEWQKIQGRFETIAFLEPAEQALRLVAAAFERACALSEACEQRIAQAVEALEAESALPLGLAPEAACGLFASCYPLHPLTLLILPVLCQKVAQNERTLFSYLASSEPFGFRRRLDVLSMGEWIEPWELFDYFLLNQAGGFSDALTHHRWIEVLTALERFTHQADEQDPAARLLKTIGLLNLIGAQRGLKASLPLLEQLFGAETEALLGRLERESLIHFRAYAREYRVWQGSDFDLQGALREALATQQQRALPEVLNALAPLDPLVARRVSIDWGTLRLFMPRFVSRETWPPKPGAKRGEELTLWFYLAEPDETPDVSQAPADAVIALCPFTEQLRERVNHWQALDELPRHHAALHQDPVAQREHREWLASAEAEALALLRTLIEEPSALRWNLGGEWREIRTRRALQVALSEWVEGRCFPKAPRIRNELINRAHPSPSAATGRKRLLAAMLEAAEQPNLGIEKDPAEKSLYLSLLKQSGLHREEAGRYGFFAPPAEDRCALRPLWDAITESLGDDGERQVEVSTIYARLQGKPYGVRLGVLPILLVAYLLANRREVALYQEGVFCERLGLEQAELLCRRPGLFALERYALDGLRGELFEQYLESIVGRLEQQASPLDVARPLLRFIAQLPEYSQEAVGLSEEARAVARLFRQAKRPGALLFEDLPRLCGVSPEDFAAQDSGAVVSFSKRLVAVLHELRDAYPKLLDEWRGRLGEVLLDAPECELADMRHMLAKRYRGLEVYAPERGALAAFVRRLADAGFRSHEEWLESIMALLGGAPARKWRDSNRLQAEARLAGLAEQLRDLQRLRAALPDAAQSRDAVLLKRVDPLRGELSHVIELSETQREAANAQAERIAAGLANMNETERLAIIAALLERFSEAPLEPIESEPES
ncbi:MAG: hypothetical protein JXM75_12105 [Chromatiaceae bacterium]|nr:hypothetical protein [Chromatiaceae bacterium]